MERFLKGFSHAFNGFIYTVKTQINFKVHLAATLAVVIMGFFFKIDRVEWLWIGLSICLVLVVELLNTAVETLVDLVSPDYNRKAGIIKDVSAAAVSVTAIFALVVAALILLPRIIVV